MTEQFIHTLLYIVAKCDLQELRGCRLKTKVAHIVSGSKAVTLLHLVATNIAIVLL